MAFLTAPIPENRKGFNPHIHGLRGLAALMVFIFHIYHMSEKEGFWPSSLDFMAPGFLALSSGVEIFFMISGFLIIASLIRHRSTGRFLLDRAIRIYPVFLFIHILIFSVGPFIGYKWMADISLFEWARHFISNVLFIPGVIKDLPLAQLNAWTLSYEAFFYVTAGSLYWAGTRVKWPVWWRISCFALIAAICFWRPLCLFFIAGIASFWLSHKNSRAPSAIAGYRGKSVPFSLYSSRSHL